MLSFRIMDKLIRMDGTIKRRNRNTTSKVIVTNCTGCTSIGSNNTKHSQAHYGTKTGNIEQ